MQLCKAWFYLLSYHYVSKVRNRNIEVSQHVLDLYALHTVLRFFTRTTFSNVINRRLAALATRLAYARSVRISGEEMTMQGTLVILRIGQRPPELITTRAR